MPVVHQWPEEDQCQYSATYRLQAVFVPFLQILSQKLLIEARMKKGRNWYLHRLGHIYHVLAGAQDMGMAKWLNPYAAGG